MQSAISAPTLRFGLRIRVSFASLHSRPEITAIGDGIDSSSSRRVPATMARSAARAESKTRTATLSPSSTRAG